MTRWALLVLLTCSIAFGQKGFVWKDHRDGRVELLENGQPALVYNYGPQLKKGMPEDRRRCCYVFPVFTPAGISMLDDFPKDHPHHRGVFWAWPVVETPDGKYDLWTLIGISDRFGKFVELKGGKKNARLTVQNGWFVKDRKIVDETVKMSVFPAQNDAREFDVEVTLAALNVPVTLAGSPTPGKSYGGLCARFAPRKETVLRADGAVIKQDEDLVPHRSAELEAIYAGKRALLRITPDPSDPLTPYQWCLRNYGFVGASFPGRNERVQSYTLAPGKPLALRFRVRVADVK